MHPILRVLVRGELITEDRAREFDELRTFDEHPLQTWARAGLDDGAIAACLSDVLRIPRADIVRVHADVRDLLAAELIWFKYVLPMQRVGDRKLMVGMVDPTDMDAIDQIRFATNLDVDPRIITMSAFQREACNHFDVIDSSPIVRLVNLLFVDLIKQERSHLEVRHGHPVLDLELQDSLVDAVIERLRSMADVPAATAVTGGVCLMLGQSSAFWFIDFTEDDESTVLRRVARDVFERHFGPLDPNLP